MVNNPLRFQQEPQRQVTSLAQQQVNQQVRPSQPVNPQYNQFNIQQQSPVFAPQQFSAQYPPPPPPPYPGQWPQQLPSVHSNTTETSEVLTQVLDRHFKLYEDRENACEQCKREKEEQKKKYRDETNDRNRINKAFEKINRFDRSNPDQCLPWMEEIFTMARTHKRNARNELIYNSGGSVQKTLYSLPSGTSEDEIHDLLHNHSNLKTSSQCISAFDSL